MMPCELFASAAGRRRKVSSWGHARHRELTKAENRTQAAVQTGADGGANLLTEARGTNELACPGFGRAGGRLTGRERRLNANTLPLLPSARSVCAV
jgi:hypothetical protein